MKREQPLTVKINGGVLTISIGVSTLALAAESGPLWPHLRVLDDDAFAADVRSALEREAEDGSTPVHKLLDQACEYAVDDGCESVDIDESDEPWNGSDPIDERLRGERPRKPLARR